MHPYPANLDVTVECFNSHNNGLCTVNKKLSTSNNNPTNGVLSILAESSPNFPNPETCQISAREADLELHVDPATTTLRHWHSVLFTDESRFTLSTCDRCHCFSRLFHFCHSGRPASSGVLVFPRLRGTGL